MILMSFKITLRLILLKALSASTNRTASHSSSAKTSAIACTKASHPPRCPAHNWRSPADSMISVLQLRTTALPMIRLKTSPIPIGLRPGFLSRGISFEANSAARELSSLQNRFRHNFLVNVAIASHKPLLYAPKVADVRIFSSHQNQDSMDPKHL